MLGHVVSGHFTTPELIYFLYDEVRSAAVHGSEAPNIPRDAQVSLDYGVRTALNEYIALARLEGITKQSRLVQALHRHVDAPEILEWLRQRNPDLWDGFELPK